LDGLPGFWKCESGLQLAMSEIKARFTGSALSVQLLPLERSDNTSIQPGTAITYGAFPLSRSLKVQAKHR
jgi:hypothetical protein